MDNQHRKIAGYRDLSQEEIDLMNRIKAKGKELLDLQAELADRINADYLPKRIAAQKAIDENRETPELIEFQRFKSAEPARWAAIGKTDIQTGIMALVRAVAQPEGV